MVVWPLLAFHRTHHRQILLSIPNAAESADSPNADPWEAAYLAFETPEEEVAKFVRRLRKLGADDWPKDSQIIELFCGRGRGLMALHRLGFTQIEGVDLSPRLLAEYRGARSIECCDCRHLTFPDASLGDGRRVSATHGD